MSTLTWDKLFSICILLIIVWLVGVPGDVLRVHLIPRGRLELHLQHHLVLANENHVLGEGVVVHGSLGQQTTRFVRVRVDWDVAIVEDGQLQLLQRIDARLCRLMHLPSITAKEVTATG